jgi:hypothetical protein
VNIINSGNNKHIIKTDGIREYQHHSNYKANQIPSSLSKVGRIRGAKTFNLHNQSLALESLKDQLGFLMTIILGSDSLFHKTKTLTSFPAPRKGRCNATLLRGCYKGEKPSCHACSASRERRWHVVPLKWHHFVCFFITVNETMLFCTKCVV